MSGLSAPTLPAPPDTGELASEAASACEQCGAPMAEIQEWCLECGAARTVIHRPPDWRIAAAVVVAVVVLVLAGAIVVIANLSGGADRAATALGAATPAVVTDTVTITTPAGAVPGAGSTATSVATPPRGTATLLARYADWPVGLSGYTVVLASSATPAAAASAAGSLTARGLTVGVLNSSQHPAMKPGRYIVFAGRYPTRAAARLRVVALRARGFDTARTALVAPTGG